MSLSRIVCSVAVLASLGAGAKSWYYIAEGEEQREEAVKNHQANPLSQEETRRRNALVMQILKEAAETNENLAHGGPGGPVK